MTPIVPDPPLVAHENDPLVPDLHSMPGQPHQHWISEEWSLSKKQAAGSHIERRHMPPDPDRDYSRARG